MCGNLLGLLMDMDRLTQWTIQQHSDLIYQGKKIHPNHMERDASPPKSLLLSHLSAEYFPKSLRDHQMWDGCWCCFWSAVVSDLGPLPLQPSLFLIVGSWTLTWTEVKEACSPLDVILGSSVSSWMSRWCSWSDLRRSANPGEVRHSSESESLDMNLLRLFYVQVQICAEFRQESIPECISHQQEADMVDEKTHNHKYHPQKCCCYCVMECSSSNFTFLADLSR